MQRILALILRIEQFGKNSVYIVYRCFRVRAFNGAVGGSGRTSLGNDLRMPSVHSVIIIFFCLKCALFSGNLLKVRYNDVVESYPVMCGL